MLIHFICRGNVYRSRLAEAYLNSKELPAFKSFSSGIAATNGNGIISWYAQRIIEKEKLVSYESPFWQKTSEELLNSADITVFMQEEYFDYCRTNLGFINKNYEFWDIKDLNEALLSKTGMLPINETEQILATEETFEKIKGKIDDLIKRFSKKNELNELE